MKKVNVKIGIVCCLRKTFDYESAWKEYNDELKNLKKMEAVEWVAIDEPCIEPEDALGVANKFASEQVDGIIITAGTFHLGNIALMINNVVKKPIYLWALPEAPYNGGKIRYNSVCGIHVDASNLYKSGVKNYYQSVTPTIDEAWVDAIRMKKVLGSAKIGMVGARAQGFYDLAVDELPLLGNTGVMIEHYTLDAMYNQEVSEAEMEEYKKEFLENFNTEEMSEEQIKLISRLAASTEKFIKANNLSATTVRDWPEFAAVYGCSPSGVMSLLQNRGYIMAPEGDVTIALTMLISQAIGAEHPYCADFSQLFPEDDTGLLWHGGDAPYILAHEKSEKSLDTFFAAGKGVTAGFVIREGDFSMFRIDTAFNEIRLFIEKGTSNYMEKLLKGTFIRAKFEKGATHVFNTMLEHGLAHHVSVSFVDITKPFEILAKIQGWTVIKP